MRATVESHENSPRLPPIHVLVALGQEDVSIKVCSGSPPPPPVPSPSLLVTQGLVVTICHLLQMSDRGLGVPLRKIERLFSYMYSTAPTPQLGAGGAPMVGAPLVGGGGTSGWGSGTGGIWGWLGDIWGHLE